MSNETDKPKDWPGAEIEDEPQICNSCRSKFRGPVHNPSSKVCWQCAHGRVYSDRSAPAPEEPTDALMIDWLEANREQVYPFAGGWTATSGGEQQCHDGPTLRAAIRAAMQQQKGT